MSFLFREKLRHRLPELMRRRQIDCWLTLTRELAPDPMADLLGLSGAGVAAGVFVQDGDRVHALALGSVLDAALLKESGVYDEVRCPSEPLPKAVADIAKSFGAQRVAVNSAEPALADGLSHNRYVAVAQALREVGLPEPCSSVDIITDLRCTKSPEEIEALREAARLSHELMMEALSAKHIQPGRTTEREIASRLLSRAREEGLTPSWSPAFCPIVSSGETREHAAPSPTVRVEPGHIVIIDFGVKVQGYGADLQRCAYVAKRTEDSPPEWVLRLFETCRTGIDIGLEAVRPGVVAGDVDRVVREYVLSQGYPDYPNATGHPIGLVVHEIGPMIAPKKEGRTAQTLEVGQVFTMEPSVYRSLEHPDRVRIGLEEDFVVTARGAEVLSPRQTELIVL